jgi:hypothetical protein
LVDFLKIFSQAALPNEPKHGRKHPCEVLFSQSGFGEEEFLEINQSETRIAFSGHVCYQIGS